MAEDWITNELQSAAAKNRKMSGLQPTNSSKPTFAFTIRQQQVHEALMGKAPECAKMYSGAVRVFADHDNPERYCMAGHALRELMDKIGPHLEVPVLDPELKKGQGRLNDKFALVETRLVTAEAKSGNWTANYWSGAIHKTTAALLIEVQKCVKWRKLNHKFRKSKAEAVLNKFDPLLNVLPEEIQSLRVQEWERTQNYFTHVAHHEPVVPNEFDKWLFHLEDLLLRGLAPAAKQGLDEIDAIIRAGERQ